MLKNIQTLSLPQRRFVFFVIFGGGLLGFVGVAVLLINSALNTGQRVQSVALDPAVSVLQYAALPDDNAYPPALAVLPDNTIITGSYSSGAVYSISPMGHVSELAGTRDAIGAFTGVAVMPDGASVLVIDQNDTDPRTAGGKLWRVPLVSGDIAEFPTSIDATGWIAPNDLTFDSTGRLYVTDPGRNEVWRFDADGSNGTIWFVPPPTADSANQRRAVTGLAYDALTDSMLVTDPEQNMVYRVSVSDASASVIYQHGDRPNLPGFDGLTVAPDGTIYAAALGQNGIARIDEANNELVYIAGLFRGASDVEYAAPGLLYVTNFDQASIVLPFVAPQLPFALDVIDLTMPSGSATP